MIDSFGSNSEVRTSSMEWEGLLTISKNNYSVRDLAQRLVQLDFLSVLVLHH